MTAPFTASNGHTVVWRRDSDEYMTVTDGTRELGLSDYVTIHTLRALVEYAASIGIVAPKVPDPVTASQREAAARIHAVAERKAGRRTETGRMTPSPTRDEIDAVYGVEDPVETLTILAGLHCTDAAPLIARIKADAVAEYKAQEAEAMRAKNLEAIKKEINGPTIQESLAEQRATEAALEESWRTNSIPYMQFGERLDEDYQSWRAARGAR